MRIAGGELVLLVALAVAASLILLFATADFISYWRAYSGVSDDPPLHFRIMGYMNLASEQNLASWFSSMLLAMIALLAATCFLLDRKESEHRWLAYGWALMALIFVALSFDELGSLHERLRLPGGWAGFVLWYAPVVAVLPLYLGLFAFFRMRRNRIALLCMFLGSLAFASIPLQEYFEVEVDRGEDWQRPILHILLEEGSELAGMLLILAAFTRYILNFVKEARSGDRRHLLIGFPRGPFLAKAVAIFLTGFLVSEYVSSLLQPDHLSGNPHHWFPAFASFCTAWLIWHLPERGWTFQGLALGQIAALCVVASALLATELHVNNRVALIFAIWLVLAWACGACASRSLGFVVGSGAWAATLVASYGLLPLSLVPFGITASSLILMLTVIASRAEKAGVMEHH
jgi:hypothetical protein